MNQLRILRPGDLEQLLAVYQDAVLTQAVGLYTPAQIEAWSGHAASSNVLELSLTAGQGVGSYERQNPARLEAFGILEPADRLALLYCRGSASRRGHASNILNRLESDALGNGIRRLRTEASQLSRPLLLRRGWQVEAPETVEIGGESFLRWRMIKYLSPPPPGADRDRG